MFEKLLSDLLPTNDNTSMYEEAVTEFSLFLMVLYYPHNVNLNAYHKLESVISFM